VTDTSGNDHEADLAELREIEEAQAACAGAIGSLRAALDRIGSARSWGTYDTWFGGGLFSSMIKHDRIDDAEVAMREVDAALERLRRELADVGVDGAAVGDVGVSDLSRSLDVWFDNFFTDLGVQARLRDADERLSEVGRLLVQVSEALDHRRHDVQARITGS
jgi:hypothetical protein